MARRLSPPPDRPESLEQSPSAGRDQQSRKRSGKTGFTENREHNVGLFTKRLGPSGDIVYRDFEITEGITATLIYVAPLVDRNLVETSIMQTFRLLAAERYPPDTGRHLLDTVVGRLLNSTQVDVKDNFDTVLEPLLSGVTAIVIDGLDQVITAATRGGPPAR